MKYIKAGENFLVLNNFKHFKFDLLEKAIYLELAPANNPEEDRIRVNGYDLDWIKDEFKSREFDFDYITNNFEEIEFMKEVLKKLQNDFVRFIRGNRESLYDMDKQIKEIVLLMDQTRKLLKESF